MHLDASHADKFSASGHVNVVHKINYRPGDAENVCVRCTSIINTETRLSILASCMVTGDHHGQESSSIVSSWSIS